MQLSRRTWGGGALLGAALLLWFVSSTQTGQDETKDPSTASTAEDEVDVESGCSFGVGQRVALHLKRSSTFWIDPSAIMDKHLSGALTKPQNDTVSDSWLLLWSVESVDIHGAVVRLLGVPSSSTRQSSNGLAKLRAEVPILLQVAPNCAFGQIGAVEGTNPALLRDWQALLTLVEFVWPPGAGRTWSSVQDDTTGRYASSYSLAADKTISRTRNAFLSTNPPRPGIKAKATILASRGTASRDGDLGWFTTLDVHEHVQVDVPVKGRFADVKTTLSLRSVDVPDHDFWDASIDMELVSWTEAHDLKGQGAGGLRFSGDAVDPALVALDLDKLMGVFSGLLAEDRVGAFRILVHWLRHDPKRAQALLDAIRAGQIPTALHDEMFHALGMAGGPEARAALLEAAASPDLSRANHLQALAALKGMPEVHAETVDFLAGLWNDRSSPPSIEERAGLLASGALLNRPDTPDELRREVEESLKSALEDADGAEELSAVLGAIGNTQDDSFADDILPLLDSDNGQTQIAAFDTLNRIGSAPAPDEALEALVDLPTTRGQGYASKALQLRAEDATDEDVLWAIFLLNEPETTPFRRGALIEFLGALVDRPAARQGLIDWFQIETDVNLLKLIGRYIDGEALSQ